MKMFEPIKINSCEIRNRFVVSAMCSYIPEVGGKSNEKFYAYHEHKAKGGYGLIVTEDYWVTPTAGGYIRCGGIWDDSQIESHVELTRRVHKHGAKIFCQIYHAGRETTSAVNGVNNIAPSAIKEPTVPETPIAMTIPEIHELIEQFAKAAYRCKLAGFDGVELHAAHGYLIEQFLSPFSNKRCDEYGGSVENRSRFLVETIKAVRRLVGSEYPIQVRMTVDEYMPGGLSIEESKAIAMLAEQAGADCINVSQGEYASVQGVFPPANEAPAPYINNAAEIKKVVSIPVIGAGKINNALIAEAIVKSGKADMCVMARASLADPEMPNKVLAGRFDEIIHCVGCMQGCVGELNRGNHIRCMLNPLTAMEDEYDLSKVAEPKNILVVGGGVAGCEAAIVAATRGHKVTILERSGELGGQFIAASMPVGKGDYSSFIVWQKNMINKLGINVVYGVDADKATVDSYAPDKVIVAVGSSPLIPPVPGLKENGVIAHDILLGKVDFGSKVVVIGGGLIGAETANHIAVHGATDVSVIEMLEDIMLDGEYLPTMYIKNRFAKYNVHVHTSAKVVRVEKDAVIFEKDGAETRIDGVDTIVIATGVKPRKELEEQLSGGKYEVIAVGDASSAKNGFHNIQEGYEAGLRV